MKFKFSLAQQIEEVDRELKMRDEVYTHRVRAGQMRASVADYHIARMQAVRMTLQWLQANELTIKQKLGEAA